MQSKKFRVKRVSLLACYIHTFVLVYDKRIFGTRRKKENILQHCSALRKNNKLINVVQYTDVVAYKSRFTGSGKRRFFSDLRVKTCRSNELIDGWQKFGST